MFNHVIATAFFSRIPPTAVKSGGGSVDSIEVRYKEVQPYLEPTFKYAFKKELEQKGRRIAKRSAALGADEEQ